jgi:peroxiredoxin
MKRVVLYISDKYLHCREAQKYLDDNGIKYRLTNAKMQRGRKELVAIGARSEPALKIGNKIMIGSNLKILRNSMAQVKEQGITS